MARELPPVTRPGFTPLIDVAFLVLIFFMALPLRRLQGKLEAQLPRQGQQMTEEEPPDVVRLRVRPGPHYQLGDHEAEDPRDFVPILLALGPGHAYEVHASDGVRWGSVVALVDLLQELDLTRVQFRAASKPPASKRR